VWDVEGGGWVGGWVGEGGRRGGLNRFSQAHAERVLNTFLPQHGVPPSRQLCGGRGADLEIGSKREGVHCLLRNAGVVGELVGRGPEEE
jgi:hypothetical protein